jgi:hypothetical protein
MPDSLEVRLGSQASGGFGSFGKCGIYRVRRAFRKRNAHESQFYFGGKDRRRFHGFVTIGREDDGADYEAGLFEQLLNDPKAGAFGWRDFLHSRPERHGTPGYCKQNFGTPSP